MSSDKLWTRWGRRLPFIFWGAVISALAMFFMPNSEHFANWMVPVLFGAFMLLFMDCSFNVTMQPFRALVGDMVPEEQRNIGYSVQSLLINAGAVVGSLLPFILDWFGVANVPAAGHKVAPTVIWSFYFGGGCLLLSVLWTVFTTKEYPPAEYAAYHDLNKSTQPKMSFIQIVKTTPVTMWQLGIVQFFSWFALFMMWVFTTQGLAENIWNTLPGDSTSAAFNEAGNWVGVIFAAYSLFAAIYSVFMGNIANKFGRKPTYMWSLLLGGLGLLSMVFIHDKYTLFISMFGLGIAWAAILAMPYAILSAALPADKMGVYMGIFNATITIPQIAAGILGGVLLTMVHGHAIAMLGVAGVSMLIAAISVVFVKEKHN
jgi:maltose/moltooligosaccharide transporter